MNTPSKTKTSDQVIEENQGLVRSLALKIHRKLPPHVELDDLVAYGQIGLAEAARDFDPARGGRFSTYAYYRIRGAIYDGLSKMNWFSRSEYRRIRYNQMANDTLEADGAKPLRQGVVRRRRTAVAPRHQRQPGGRLHRHPGRPRRASVLGLHRGSHFTRPPNGGDFAGNDGSIAPIDRHASVGGQKTDRRHLFRGGNASGGRQAPWDKQVLGQPAPRQDPGASGTIVAVGRGRFLRSTCHQGGGPPALAIRMETG